MYGGYFDTKEQAEKYREKHELYVMIPFFSVTKKKWCLIFDLKVKSPILEEEKKVRTKWKEL